MGFKMLPGPCATFEELCEELDYLYQRLTAVDELIRSLEAYERYRARPMEIGDLKTA